MELDTKVVHLLADLNIKEKDRLEDPDIKVVDPSVDTKAVDRSKASDTWEVDPLVEDRATKGMDLINFRVDLPVSASKVVSVVSPEVKRATKELSSQDTINESM